jgi:membrane associated rhomboid family serine protease
VFPIGDEDTGNTIRPYVNWAIIVLCFLAFFYELSLSSRQLDAFILEFGAIPRNISQFRDLYTILSSMFVHGGWAHILGNMLFLYIFGDNIEDAMGHLPYLLFYLICGIVAALAQVFLDPTSTIPIIGASGAISGVLGAYIVLFPQGKVRAIVFFGAIGQIVLVPAWVMLGLWFLLQLFSGFASLGASSESGGVAFWAHVGGFIAGVVLVWLFRDKDAVVRQNAFRQQGTSWQRVPAGSRARGQRGPF